MRKYLIIRFIISYCRIVFYKIIYRRKLHLKGWKYYFGNNTYINIEQGKIDVDDKLYLRRGCEINCSGGRIKIGYNNFFNNNCNITSMGNISIGNNNLFAPNVGIFDHNHNYNNQKELICKQGFTIKNIEIGSNVWIGSNVIITAGSKIGDRVIIGANSVVKGCLVENSFYSGNPAKLIKKI